MTVKLRNATDTYGNCTVCGAYCVHKTSHVCPPRWRVTLENEGFERVVFARSPEAAAEAYCDQNDCDLEYQILRCGEATLVVEGNGKQVRVHVEAESRPTYTAHEIDGA